MMSNRKRPHEAVDPLPWTDEPAHGGLYTFEGLRRADVTAFNHGLHKFPAKYLPQLAQWGIDYCSSGARQRVLDPFCGSGTTNLQAALSGHSALGVDISPLAVLIAEAKTLLIASETGANQMLAMILKQASDNADKVEKLLQSTDDWELHDTWRNWFRLTETSRIIALRESINKIVEERGLANFFRACLSSVVKQSSFLSEDQIKVRFDSEKKIADPLESFSKLASKAIKNQIEAARYIAESGGSSIVSLGTAADLQANEAQFDRVVTSPPYINAVDYTMAHKYNLFALGLIEPQEFKNHCRDYIGMTERAVRANDLKAMPKVGGECFGEVVNALWNQDKPVAKNRAYVTAQYFLGMKRSLSEIHRVLKADGLLVMVVGTTNRICGNVVPTADLVKELGSEQGLTLKLEFKHLLANRSSMRMNRSATGGTVKTETVLVMQKQ